MPLPAHEIDRLITGMFAEDMGDVGDVTSNATLSAEARLKADLVAREDMVVAGLVIAVAAFKKMDAECSISLHVNDGDKVKSGTSLLSVSGNARAMLGAERQALNILQHMSGIATLTRHYVDEIAGTGATLLDTRKTTPLLRTFDKYAALMGGAKNHRIGLYDAILIKDNHIAAAGGVTAAVKAAKAQTGLSVEVECDTLDQADEALDAGADSLLLDNMSNDQLREAVTRFGGKCPLEASGGVNLQTIRAIAETGVTYISVGRITQSAPAVDIGMDYRD